MSTPLKTRWRRYLVDAGSAFERAPVEVAAVVFLAAAFSYAIETSEAPAAWIQLAVAVVLVLAAAWTGTLLQALGTLSYRGRWLVTSAGVVAAALYGWLVPDLELVSEGWRAALLVAGSLVWLLAMPAFGGPRSSAVDRLRDVDGRILLRALGALLYTAALYAGLALALAAIDNLFELKLDEKIYAHVFGWLFFVLAPWIVIGGLPEYVRPAQPRTEVAGVVHRMTGFLVPPLLALYYTILYAYVLRITIVGELPRNLVSPMVLAAGVLGILTLFLFEPRPDGGTGARYLRFAPPLFVPLAALGLWTILLRVDQYGWTEFRLLRLSALIVFGLFAIGATIQLLRQRRFALQLVPLVVAVVLLLGAVGPWSVLSVARASQRARLHDALAMAGISPTGPRPADRRTVPNEVYDQIRDAARYLAQHFGPTALPPLLRTEIAGNERWIDLADRIGLRRATMTDMARPFANGQLSTDSVIRLNDRLTLYRVFVGPARAPSIGALSTVVDSMTLRIRHGTEVLHADLAAVFAALDRGSEPRLTEFTTQQAVVEVRDHAGRRRGTLVVLSINAGNEAGALKVNRLEALLLLEHGQ